MSAARPWLIALALLGTAACGNGDGLNNPERSGSITFELETPFDDDGALLVAVSGGPVDSVTAAHPGDLRVYAAAGQETGTKAVVTGAIATGPLLTVHIPDARQATAYTATIVDAAARVTYESRDVSGYRLRRR